MRLRVSLTHIEALFQELEKQHVRHKQTHWCRDKLCTCEHSDVLNTLDEIHFVFTSKREISSIY